MRRKNYQVLPHNEMIYFEAPFKVSDINIYSKDNWPFNGDVLPDRYRVEVGTIKQEKGLIISIYDNLEEHYPLVFFRNYPSIEFCYVKQNNQDFLITSEDYQTIAIINLTTNTINVYGDPDDIAFGGGFCPIEFEFDSDYNVLTIEGCVWACPYEKMQIAIPDLNNPDFNNAEYYDEDFHKPIDWNGLIEDFKIRNLSIIDVIEYIAYFWKDKEISESILLQLEKELL